MPKTARRSMTTRIHVETAASPTANTTADEESNTNLLADLERRQDDVLLQLDELDRKLTALLTGLGVTFVDERPETQPLRLADVDDSEDDEELPRRYRAA